MTSGIFSYLGGDSELSHSGESSTFFNQTWDDWLVSYSDCLKPPTSEKYVFFYRIILYIYTYICNIIYIYMYHVSLNMFGVHLIVLFMGHVLDITNTVCVYIYIIRIDCDMIVKCERHQE